MRAFLILEDGTVLEGIRIGAEKEIISEIVFNTSMAGYPEVLTDPSYAGQAVCMTYPMIGNYGVCREDMESSRPWVDGLIIRELARRGSNFRKDVDLGRFLEEFDVPGIAGIDTRALTTPPVKGVYYRQSSGKGNMRTKVCAERFRRGKESGAAGSRGKRKYSKVFDEAGL